MRVEVLCLRIVIPLTSSNKIQEQQYLEDFELSMLVTNIFNCLVATNIVILRHELYCQLLEICEVKNKVGNNIRKLRQARGMSQENVADEIGMGASSYSKIERGETDPNLTRLVDIARVLEVDVVDLLSDHDKMLEESNKDYGKLDLEQLNKTLQILVTEIQNLRSDLSDKKEPTSRPKAKPRKKP